MPAARKKAATRKRASPKRKPAPAPIAAPDGQTLHVLEVPYPDRAASTTAGAKWDPVRRAHVFVGNELPGALQRYAPKRWSWAAYLHDQTNGVVPGAVAGDGTLVPRPHQVEAIDAIAAAHKTGRPGFVLADKVGLGKTLSAVAGVQQAAATGPTPIETVLVVAPLSVLAGWRSTLERYGDGGLRWVLINYESLKKLLEKPAAALSAKKTKTKNRHHARDGKPLAAFDVIVWDESHRLKRHDSQTTAAARRLAQSDPRRGDRAAFQVWMSATLGSNPLEVSYLAPMLSFRTGKEVTDLKAFGTWCDEQGLGVTRGEFGNWDYDPTPQAVQKVQSLLFGDEPPVGLRRVPEDLDGWPELQRFLLPLELDETAMSLYRGYWTEFRAAMGLAHRGNDPTSALAAMTRLRQQASLLRAPIIAKFCLDLTASGIQPVVSVKWLETLAAIEEAIGSKAQVSRISGQLTADERELDRQKFQAATDKAVMLFTPVEGINLHATEQHANGVQRVTVIADPRWSPIQSAQAEGRAHRDGERADAYYCFAADTIEERIVATLIDRLGKMSAMHGDAEESEFKALAATLMDTDTPWA